MNDVNKVDMSSIGAGATKVQDQGFSSTEKSPEGMQEYNLKISQSQ
jgi:hypothetical protein